MQETHIILNSGSFREESYCTCHLTLLSDLNLNFGVIQLETHGAYKGPVLLTLRAIHCNLVRPLHK